MNKTIFGILFAAMTLSGSQGLGARRTQASSVISFSGNARSVIMVEPERSTGLDGIYVADGVSGLVVTAGPVSGSPASAWYSYDIRGGGFAEVIGGIEHDGNNTLLRNPKGDTGYIVEYPDGTRIYFWLTDYSAHPLVLKDVALPAAPDCNMTELRVDGSGDAIHYTTINGRQMVLSREISVNYLSLQWDEESLQFRQTEEKNTLESITGTIFISPAPLCNTTFTVTGDRFLREWGEEQSVTSPTFNTISVDARTTAERTNKKPENSNQINTGEGVDGLGGSAPADIAFRAYVTDALLHSEWQFSTTPGFEEITQRFNQQDLDHTFNEEGTTYVRFVGSNFDGSCEVTGDVYTVTIGSSELKCPNAFSPGASEGVNDEWKVSYRSIVEFECWIFDRNGVQLFHFSDPEQGWDGKYRGKLVRPGVYYYVIEAKGADGKQYRKSGDINILRYKLNDNRTGGSGD